MSELNLKWYDIAEWGVEGQGWTGMEKPYDRIPARAKKIVTQDVWNLSHSPTGICVHFNTDSTRIYGRWQLESDQLGEDNFNVTGFSGLDLYCFDEKNQNWRWAGAPPHFSIKDKNPETLLIEGLEKKMRQYRIYLPLRNPTLKVEIGVDDGLVPVPPRKDKPIVYYGTSIVHGAFAARPGLGTSQVLGRRLDMPLINLGFSGNAKMEAPLGELIAEIDAGIFVIDALPNMDTAMVKERAEKFIKIICDAHPDTPVVLVEDHPNMLSWLKPEAVKGHKAKWNAFSKVYRKLLKEGYTNLSYVKGEKLFGTDNEASVDGVHPSDLGYMRMADIMEKAMKKALSIC